MHSNKQKLIYFYELFLGLAYLYLTSLQNNHTILQLIVFFLLTKLIRLIKPTILKNR